MDRRDRRARLDPWVQRDRRASPETLALRVLLVPSARPEQLDLSVPLDPRDHKARQEARALQVHRERPDSRVRRVLWALPDHRVARVQPEPRDRRDLKVLRVRKAKLGSLVPPEPPDHRARLGTLAPRVRPVYRATRGPQVQQAPKVRPALSVRQDLQDPRVRLARPEPLVHRAKLA